MSPPRSDHFNGKTFFQPHHATAGGWATFLRWRLTTRPAPWPKRVAVPAHPPPPAPRGGEVVVTWIGHATFLLQTSAGNVLTDPVFSERTSPVSWAGPRRVHPPGLALTALPRIDAVLLSHDHYDHCDLASLRQLATRTDATFIAPLRHRDLLTQAGARRIVELDWWERHRLGAAEITLTPSKHWSNRFGSPRNHRLWGGFHLRIPPPKHSPGVPAEGHSDHRLWFVGDSGYDASLNRDVRDRLGPPDLAFVPIGAYEPRWFMAPMHMNPAEAVRLHCDVGARQSIAMHWGTFQLTDEAREAPVQALAAARTAAGLAPEVWRVLDPGESLTLAGAATVEP